MISLAANIILGILVLALLFALYVANMEGEEMTLGEFKNTLANGEDVVIYQGLDCYTDNEALVFITERYSEEDKMEELESYRAISDDTKIFMLHAIDGKLCVVLCD